MKMPWHRAHRPGVCGVSPQHNFLFSRKIQVAAFRYNSQSLFFRCEQLPVLELSLGGGKHRSTSALKLTTFPRVVIRGAQSEIDLNITTHLLLRRERTSAEREKKKLSPGRMDGRSALPHQLRLMLTQATGRRRVSVSGMASVACQLANGGEREKLFVRVEYLFSDAYSNRWTSG